MNDKTFEELHPDLNPSKYCGEVKSYHSYKLINGRNRLVEAWERDDNGEMKNVTETVAVKELTEAQIEAKLQKLMKLKEKLENEKNA